MNELLLISFINFCLMPHIYLLFHFYGAAVHQNGGHIGWIIASNDIIWHWNGWLGHVLKQAAVNVSCVSCLHNIPHNDIFILARTALSQPCFMHVYAMEESQIGCSTEGASEASPPAYNILLWPTVNNYHFMRSSPSVFYLALASTLRLLLHTTLSNRIKRTKQPLGINIVI